MENAVEVPVHVTGRDRNPDFKSTVLMLYTEYTYVYALLDLRDVTVCVRASLTDRRWRCGKRLVLYWRKFAYVELLRVAPVAQPGSCGGIEHEALSLRVRGLALTTLKLSTRLRVISTLCPLSEAHRLSVVPDPAVRRPCAVHTA